MIQHNYELNSNHLDRFASSSSMDDGFAASQQENEAHINTLPPSYRSLQTDENGKHEAAMAPTTSRAEKLKRLNYMLDHMKSKVDEAENTFQDIFKIF